MTNPNNIVRVRARNGGRASVYEANGWAQTFSTGLLEGNGVIQNTSADLHVLVGGQASKPDVLIAENPAGYKVALDIVGQQAITITTPASNSRISAIVAYTDDLSLSTDQDTVTGSPASCGLIVVNGSAASSPVAPTDAQIRSAITSDGATGSQAAYCVIATITVSRTTTAITDSIININQAAMNGGKSIADASITANKIDFTTLNVIIDSNPSYSIYFGTSTYSKTFTLPKTGYYIIHDSWCGVFKRASNNVNTLDVKIDGDRIAQYAYASVTEDSQWGSTRRTITGQDSLVYLTAGEHTLTTSGNLYYDDSYHPKYHTISAEYFSES